MLFNSMYFLIFFPIVVLVYYIIPKKIKNLWLLIASYYFYMCWNAKYALLIMTSTVIITINFFCRAIEKSFLVGSNQVYAIIKGILKIFNKQGGYYD